MIKRVTYKLRKGDVLIVQRSTMTGSMGRRDYQERKRRKLQKKTLQE